MKRFLVLSGALLFSGLLVGCGSDSRVGLVKDTTNMVETAASNVGNIKTRVDEAVKEASGGKKLNLSEAIEATKELKVTGERAQEIRRKIEKVRASITDEDKKSYAQSEKSKLTTAFEDLSNQKNQLRVALANAEKLPGNAKIEVKALREKIIEAESPFEALSR